MSSQTELRVDAALLDALDLAVGVVAVAAEVARRARGALEPSFLPERLWPARALAPLVRPVLRRGHQWRQRLTTEAVAAFDVALPVVLDVAMRRLQPTDLVRRYVDLDALVATVDLDAVVAAVDLDAVAERLDVQAVVARVDVDEIASRLDVDAVLDRVDLTATVLRRVDLQAIADAVLTQVDVPALVEQVLDEIDLPEIIRSSTGTMASDTVRTVRMQGVNADEAVSRLVDRLRIRHNRPAPGGAT